MGDPSVGTLVSGSLEGAEEGSLDWQGDWKAHSQTLEGAQQ